MRDVTEKLESTAPPKTLGERVKVARLAAGLSAKKLEETAGVSEGLVSRIESGKRGRRLTHPTVEKLAAALGVSPSYITGEQTGVRGAQAALPPPLESIPGYEDAALVVARLEPHIPLEVFREARQTRFASPPDRVTPAYLRELVRFLARSEWKDETAEIAEKIERKKKPKP